MIVDMLAHLSADLWEAAIAALSVWVLTAFAASMLSLEVVSIVRRSI